MSKTMSVRVRYEPIEPLPGETIQVRVEHVQGEAPGFDGASEGADSSTNLIVGLVLFAVIGAAFVVFLVRRQRGDDHAAGDAGDEPHEDDEDGQDTPARPAEADRDDSADGKVAGESEPDESYAFDVDDAGGEGDE